MTKEKPPAIFWELVDSESETILERAEIPSGWLYRCRLIREHWNRGAQTTETQTLNVSIAFVPNVVQADNAPTGAHE